MITVLCGLTTLGSSASAGEMPTLVRVTIQTLASTEEADSLLFPARVQSAIQTKIYAESEGVVRAIPVHVGQPVSKRDRLMTVQHTDPVYRYAPVKITSPVSGTVSSLEVTEGTSVTKGACLATVIDPSRLKIAIEIPAQDLAKIRPGMSGEFRATPTTEARPVRIVGVSPLVDPKTGTAPAELVFEKDQAGGAAAPGTLGLVLLRTNLHLAILMPEDAIVYREGKPMVRKLDGERMKLTSIELGERRRGKIEIRSGLAAGDRVILRASRFVSDGEGVKVEAEKAADKGADQSDEKSAGRAKS